MLTGLPAGCAVADPGLLPGSVTGVLGYEPPAHPGSNHSEQGLE